MLNHTKQLVRVLYLVRLRALLGLAGIGISNFKPHSVRASRPVPLHLLRYFLLPFSELLVGQDTAPLQSITKGNPRTWEFGRSWSLIVILLSYHEVPWITCPPLLAYVVNPPNLRFVRLSKLISGIGLRNLMWLTLFRFGMPWTTLTQTESITSRFKLEVLKRIFQNRNFIQKF